MMNGTSTYRPLYAVHRGRCICVHANKLTNNNIKITLMTLKTVLNIVNMFENLANQNVLEMTMLMLGFRVQGSASARS